SLDIGSNAHVSFTPQLEKGGFGVEMTPTIVAWQIVEVPDTNLTRGSTSVDFKIKTQAIVTKPSGDSQAEDELYLKYRSVGGMDTAYEGSEAGIPWADINEVYGIMWKDGAVYLTERQPKVVIEAVDERKGTVDVIKSVLF
ncbi:MAG: hypothetical protein P1V35_09635, partial [Planctomycetota bacterium]|nr:hypothetical protein [Planctomycetota bacterium]